MFGIKLPDLGRMTGIRINPFRPGEASIRRPNVNLGDLMELGSYVGGPIGNAASLAGMVSPLIGGMQGGGSGGVAPQGMGNMQNVLDTEFMRNFAARNRAREAAIRALDPANVGGEAAVFGSRARGMAQGAGARSAQALRSRGYGSGVQDAARLSALNQANEAEMGYLSNAMSPIGASQRAMMQNAMAQMDPAVLQFIQAQQAIQGANQNAALFGRQMEATRPNSLFENLLTMAPGVIDGILAQQRRPAATVAPVVAAARKHLRGMR